MNQILYNLKKDSLIIIALLGMATVGISYGNGFPIAQALTVTATTGHTDSSSFSIVTRSPTPFFVWTCLGQTSSCGTSPSSSWQAFLGSPPLVGGYYVHDSWNDDYPPSRWYPNLRPGRTYGISYAAHEAGNQSNSTSGTMQVTTWPGPQPQVTVSGLTSTSATLSWNTSFLGDTELRYVLTPPGATWLSQNTPFGGGARVKSVAGISTGQLAAISFDGEIATRNNNIWTTRNNPRSGYKLFSIDMFNTTIGYIVGEGGTIIRTLDGSNWNLMNPPAGFASTLINIYAGTSSTAWAVGQDESILFYDGASWTSKYPTGIPSKQLNRVVTIDNKEVWVGDHEGRIWRTVNAGTSWTQTTLPKPGAELAQPIWAVSTIDGITLWAGGDGGRLWRSTNSGNTWSLILSGGLDGISDISMAGPKEIWFVRGQSIGHSINADMGSPTFDFTVNPNGYLVPGSSYDDITADSAGEVIVTGTNNVISYNVCNYGCVRQGGISGTTHTLTLSLVPGITYYYAALSTGTDAAGDFRASALGSFSTPIPDPDPPTISFTDPDISPKLTNISPYLVKGVANDIQGLTSVTLTNNGMPQSVSGLNSWSASVPLTVGNNNLVATATDGYWTPSVSATLIYDNQKPTINITSPLNNSTVNTSTINVVGNAFDLNDIPLNSMSWQIDGGPRNYFPHGSGQSVNWNTNVTGLIPGSNLITVYVKDKAGNENSASVTVIYEEPTFTITATPVSQIKNAGDLATYQVTVTSKFGFDKAVSLSAGPTPSGSTITFTPNSITPPANGTATSTMTIQTAVTTPTQLYTITITGSGGGKTTSTSVTLDLKAPPDFQLSATPSSQTVMAGNITDPYIITATSNSTFAPATVNYTISGLPAGATATFGPPASVSLGSSDVKAIILKISTLMSTPDGSWPLIVTGTAGALIRTCSITLVVSPAPDFTFQMQPSSQNILAGGLTSYTGTLTALYGFSEPIVSIAATSPDPNITLQFAPDNFPQILPSGSQFIMNVTTTSALATGTYTIDVSAKSTTLTKTVPVSLVVGADITPPIISNIKAAPNYNSVRITWDTNEPANSLVTLYFDAARTSWAGSAGDASYCTSPIGTCHDISISPLTPLTTYYFTVTSDDLDANPPPPTPNSTTRTTKDDGITPLQFTTLDEPDLIPPEIFIDDPVTGQDKVGIVPIVGRAKDNKDLGGIGAITITITPPSGAKFSLPSLDCTGLECNWATSWNTVSGENGQHIIEARAFDLAGNPSAPPASVTVNIVNDNTFPKVTNVTAKPEMMPGEMSCGGQCWKATITWNTDDKSTSKVEYNVNISCTATPPITCTYCLNPEDQNPATRCTTRWDDTVPANPNPDYTSHQVTLTYLKPDQLYHYRVSSCNISGLCSN